MEKRKQINLWTHDKFPVFLFCFSLIYPIPGALKTYNLEMPRDTDKKYSNKNQCALSLSLSLTKGPGRGPPSKTDNNCAIPAKQGRKYMTPPPPWSVKAKEELDKPLPRS